MTDPGQLLRMLEPAVRPVSTPPTGTPAKPANTPFESQSFDQLLQQATTAPSTASAPGPSRLSGMEPPTESPETQSAPNPATFQPLSGIDRIENQSLRNLIANSTHTPNPDR